ncbi:MAG: hypothetical protein GY854_04995 [Deltaproteobacteria bacterium]|nr:hypothetical protein [Deltaproteobacteria bacterium]
MPWRHIPFMLVILLGAAGCSAALDFDELTQGTEEDTDSEQPVDTDTGKCTSDSECVDEIDCTEDLCKSDGTCTHVPDNDKCGYLEMCDRDLGCIDTGKDCLVNSDCNDDVDCTRDTCSGGLCLNKEDDDLCITAENKCMEDMVCIADTGCTLGHEKACSQTGLSPCHDSVCNPATGDCEEVLSEHADDDEDGFLNADCGGDDCDDTAKDVYPGQDELCNLLDDNCDGFTDMEATAGPVVVEIAADLRAPNVAFDGKRYAVVWQRDDEDEADVFARVLGTGSCLVDVDCEVDGGIAPASEPVNLTPKGGVSSAGVTPSIAAGDGAFFVAWASKETGKNPAILLESVAYDDVSSDVTVWDDAKTLSSAEATEVFEPRITWSEGAAGWIATWGRRYSDETTAVELMDMSMLAGSVAPFTGNIASGDLSGISLASLDEDDIVIAYSFTDAASGSNAEVLEARLSMTETTWDYTASWPRTVSTALGEFEDPSSQPSVTRIGDATWVTTYSDVRVPTGGNTPESESDIRCIRSDNTAEVVTLFEDSTFDQSHPSMAYDGSGFGLLYTNVLTAGQTLDFRLLDSEMVRLPNQGGRLARLQPGEVRASNIIYTGDGFAVAWIEALEDKDDILRFAAFKGCTAIPEE